MKKINITINTEEERDRLIKELKELEFKNKLPKELHDLEFMQGFRIGDNSNVYGIQSSTPSRSIFKTEFQAFSAMAKAELSQYMHIYNDGWYPDWNDIYQPKYCIYRNNNDIKVAFFSSIYHFLSFKTLEIAKEFKNNFGILIRQYHEIVEDSKNIW